MPRKREEPERRLLVETIVAMRVVGRTSTVETMERIRVAAPELYPPLAELVDRIPSLVGKIAADVLREATLEPGQDPAQVRAVLARINDPRNYREVCDGLTVLLDAGEDSQVVRAMERALAGVSPWVRKISVLLSATGLRGEGALSYVDGVLRIGDASLSVEEANQALGIVEGWHRAHAGSAVVAARPDTFGSEVQVAPLVDDSPLWALEERSLVLLPGRTGARRKIAVEPVPKDLGAPLDLRKHVGLEFLPGVDSELELALTSVVAASLRVASLVLQHQFFSVLDDVRVVVHPEEVSLAYLVPESSTLHVFLGPLGPYVLVHELGHLVDSRLARGSTFRSDEEGSALASFAAAARPMYAPVVRVRATQYARMLAEAALPGLPTSGYAPVEEVVAGLPFVDEDERAGVVQDVIDGVAVSSRRSVVGSVGRRIEQVMAAIGESLLLEVDVPADHRPPAADHSSGVLVDLRLLSSELISSEERRLLSSPEIFARFFDQYGRLLAEQKGLAFGPRVRPSDLDLPSVGRLAPLFLDTIFHEQKEYLEQRAAKRGLAKLSDTLVAGVTAIAGAAAVAFLPNNSR